MQQDFLYQRLKFTRAVITMFKETMQSLENDLVTHALDDVKVLRRYRMMSQVCSYQGQILRKIPDFVIESDLDLDQCLRRIRGEISVLTDKSS
jgi:hypothetical protein